MSGDALWRALFAGAVAVLMFGILSIRSDPVPPWVLLVYPIVGALLAHIASRTSPSVDSIARLETSTVAAAAIFVLAILVNGLLLDMIHREATSGEITGNTRYGKVPFLVLPSIGVLLWWALERRLTRWRRRHPSVADAPLPPTAEVEFPRR